MTAFPESFLWGAATSAYQIEGSPLADGAGASIWHRFCRMPGRVEGGHTGDVACDHYRRSGGDVDLMRLLGLRAYRFSVAWGRVLPAGRGPVNPPGLDFYERLVDALLSAGIVPCATLYHWDLPAALEDRGGWLDPDVAGWFADYAAVVVRRLADRVPLWATLNEPAVVLDGGYVAGNLAPGHQSFDEAPRVSRHLLRAHVEGVRAARSEGARSVGLVVNLEPKHPASDRAEDRAAARRADAWTNRQFLDPLLLGSVPEELGEVYGPSWTVESLALGPAEDRALDFLGVNYYTRRIVRNDPAELPLRAAVVPRQAAPHTAMDWEVHPPGLTEVLVGVRDRYGAMPLYITENGAAFDEPASSPEPIEDLRRVDYLREHLHAVGEALAAGVDVRGYFVWSLLDNFEWAHGYSKRFGIVHVDFATQARTPKASARWYADVIGRGGVPG